MVTARAIRRGPLWPVTDAESHRLGPVARCALIAEVLTAYLPALRSLRTGQLEAMVSKARSVRPRASAPAPALEYMLALRLGNATMRTLAQLPTDKRCLVRSLVLLRLLARRSISGTLVIGVRPAPEFLAHAWVEATGRPVLPAGDFERLTEL